MIKNELSKIESSSQIPQSLIHQKLMRLRDVAENLEDHTLNAETCFKILSRLKDEDNPEYLKGVINRIPVGQVARISDISAAILYLIGPNS